jgi:hypothetical protein
MTSITLLAIASAPILSPDRCSLCGLLPDFCPCDSRQLFHVPAPASASASFAGCVLCGGALDSRTEKEDGICYGCNPDAPLPLLPTDTGRAVLAYLDAQADFCHQLSLTEDEDRVPAWSAPAVVNARRRRNHIADVLAALDFAPCEDCGLLDCCCPDV